MTGSRIAYFLAAAGVAAAIIGAPHAVADPADLVPMCSGDETPIDDNCRPAAYQVFTSDSPGADPELPTGTDPGLAPGDPGLQGSQGG